MSFGDAEDVIAFVAAEALDESEFQWIEPELGCGVVARDVDMRRLQPVGHVEEEAVAAFAKDCWHGSIVGKEMRFTSTVRVATPRLYGCPPSRRSVF